MLLRWWARGAISLPPEQDCDQVCSWVETAYVDLPCLGGVNFFKCALELCGANISPETSCSSLCQGLSYSQAWLQQGFVTWRQIFQMFCVCLTSRDFCSREVWKMGMNTTVKHLQFSFPRPACYLRVLRTTPQIPFYLSRFRARRFSSSGWATSRWTTMKGHSFRRPSGDWVKAKDVLSTLIVREHQSLSENGGPLKSID